jgi:hypothetical protein
VIKDIPEPWKEYRRRNLVAAFGLVLGYPVVGAMIVAIRIWRPAYADDALLMLTIIWFGFWAWSALRVARFPCPRCGQAWLSSQGAAWGAKRRCSHCGLGLYERP